MAFEQLFVPPLQFLVVVEQLFVLRLEFLAASKQIVSKRIHVRLSLLELIFGRTVANLQIHAS